MYLLCIHISIHIKWNNSAVIWKHDKLRIFCFQLYYYMKVFSRNISIRISTYCNVLVLFLQNCCGWYPTKKAFHHKTMNWTFVLIHATTLTWFQIFAFGIWDLEIRNVISVSWVHRKPFNFFLMFSSFSLILKHIYF